jgi:hypothetical protein
MADNNTSRFRSSDPYGRAAPSSAPANDPLAELARLIGQNDPFAEFGTRPEHGQQPEQGGYDQYPPQPYNGQPYNGQQYAPEPQQYAPDGQQYAPDQQQYAPESQHYAPEPTQPYHPEPAPQFEELPPLRFGSAPHSQPQHPPHDDWPGTSAQQPSAYQHQQPETYGVPPPMRPVPGFEPAPFPEPIGHSPSDYRTEPPPFDIPQRTAADPLPSFLTSPGQAHQGYGQQAYAQQPPIYPPQPEAGAMPAPHDDEFYDDAPRGRRKGMLTVAAVLVLAVVGTAGAVAYRNYFGGPTTSGPPPVIRASGEPSKVPPPPQATASTDLSKVNYERFPERSKDEKIVGREEKPIDQRDLTRTPPREILSGPSVATPPQRPNMAAGAVNTIGTPKAVRTVPISPNNSETAMNTPSTTPDQTMLPAPPARQGGVNFPPPPARQVESKPERPAPAPTRTVNTASRAAATSGNAPLSLSPNAAAEPAPPPQASAYREPTPAPAPRATASSGGRFHVQVSSQRSQSDAESSFRSIQSKYSSVLGGQPHTIRRADLGAKGTYYRAMVGPYGSREEAIRLCSSLKSAGGDCVVQAN